PLLLSSQRYCPQRHSFPTRRSSDLTGRRGYLDTGHGQPGITWTVQAIFHLHAHRPVLIIHFKSPHVGKMNLFSQQSTEIPGHPEDRKSTRLNSSHVKISYAVFCLKK